MQVVLFCCTADKVIPENMIQPEDVAEAALLPFRQVHRRSSSSAWHALGRLTSSEG